MWFKTGVLAVAVTLALGSEARAEAVCALDIQGSGKGTARCVGSIGKWTVDPSPVPAEVGDGWVTFRPRRLVSLDPDPTMRFSGRWRAVGALVSGQGVIEGATVPFVGDLRRAAGGLQMELVLGREQTQTRSMRARGRPRMKPTGEGCPVPKPPYPRSHLREREHHARVHPLLPRCPGGRGDRTSTAYGSAASTATATPTWPWRTGGRG